MKQVIFALFLLLFICPLYSQNNLRREDKQKCIPSFPSDNKIEWFCYKIKKGDNPQKLFGDKWEEVVRFNRMDRRHFNAERYIKIPVLLNKFDNFYPMPKSVPNRSPKYILVNLKEQFLGCYEFGKLKYSFPVAVGKKGYETPKGEYKVLEYHAKFRSTKYFIKGTKIHYPMFWGIRFHEGYWFHGRDIPGYPASHGCIGLYDEKMQKRFYGFPSDPSLKDAEIFFNWLFLNGGMYRLFPDGAPNIKIEIK